MQRKHGNIAAATLMLLIGLMVLIAMPLPPVQAIGEVTPTPTTPPQPTPVPDLSVDELLNEAVGLIQNGQLAEAIDLLDRAIEAEPENAEAYAIRGVAYNRQGRLLRAVDDFSRAIDLIPYEWSFHVFRADSYAQLEDYEQAMRDYDRAIELNPRYELAFLGRAALHNQLGNLGAARVDELIAEGLRNTSFGSYPDAIDSYSRAIDADSDPPTSASAVAYYNRALTYYINGDLGSALEDYDRAVEIDPQMHDAYLGRGIARRESGDERGAGEDFYERIQLLESRSFEETVERGSSVVVEMAYGSVYRVALEGLGGDLITVSARDADASGVDPLLVVLDPDGVPIAGDDDFGGNLDSLIEDLRLPRDGTYTLVVSHANGGFDGPIRVAVE